MPLSYTVLKTIITSSWFQLRNQAYWHAEGGGEGLDINEPSWLR